MNSDRILIENFIRNHPLDATRILERQKQGDTASLLNDLPDSLAANLIKKMQMTMSVKCLELMPVSKSALVIEKLPLVFVSVLLRQLELGKRNEILNNISEKVSGPVRAMLNYPENSAGAIADPMIFSFPDDITVEEALDRVRNHPETTTYYLYVVDRDHLLKGVINLRELMLAKSSARLETVMQYPVAALPAEFSLQAILNHPAWRNYHSLPVISDSGQLLGAIRYEILRQIESEVKGTHIPRQVIAAGSALGELFQIGLSGLIQSAATQFVEPSKEE
jgi:magnesium transporter